MTTRPVLVDVDAITDGHLLKRNGAKIDGTANLMGSSITSLTGDVAATGPGAAAATIANDAVTYAKMQNVSATDKVLGRSTAGAGNVEEIACTAAGRALIDDATAADQRTTLGLGTLATQSGTFSGTHSGTSSGTNTGDQTITLTGNVTGSGTGSFAATIANDAVTYAKMQNVSATDKVLGRSTAGAGDVEEIACTASGRAMIGAASAAAQTALLSNMVGDSGAGGTKGLVPAPAAGDAAAAKFLKADGTFAVPAGTGLTISQSGLCQGRLDYTSATSCTFVRYDGDYIEINGTLQTIGSSGIAMATTDNRITSTGADAGAALSSLTRYPVYVSNASASTFPSDMRASTTDPSLVNGFYYLGTSGNALNWRYVGTIYTNGSTQLEMGGAICGVRSFYNRKRIMNETTPSYSNGNSVSSFTSASTTWAVSITNSTIFFPTFPLERNLVDLRCFCLVQASASGTAGIGISTDGTAANTLWEAYVQTNYIVPAMCAGSVVPATNTGVTFMMVVRSAAGTATFYVDDARNGATADPRICALQAISWS